MEPGFSNWLDSLQQRADFYSRRSSVARRDGDFDWSWFRTRPSGRWLGLRRFAKTQLHRWGLRPTAPISTQWLRDNAERLWATRRRFEDDISRWMFDEHLVLKIADHDRYFFPRIDFEDLLAIVDEQAFRRDGFPDEYLGLPLMEFGVAAKDDAPPFRLITTRLQLDLLNRFRQYLPHRGGAYLGPRAGDVVFDCGACIGEVSLFFAHQVGPDGQVHLFDPVPLHTRFCALQGQLNPILAPVLRINTLAVADRSSPGRGGKADNGRIEPGAIPIEDFATTSLDDYSEQQGLARVDFVKMDIEGAELTALEGARRTIGRFKPRLAISAYHKSDDLWVLADKIMELNPDYRLSFGHHSPIQWESVLYAS